MHFKDRTAAVVLAACAATVLVGTPGSANAQTIGTPAGSAASLDLQPDNPDFVGQVISVPAGDVRLQSLTLSIEFTSGTQMFVIPYVYTVNSISGGTVRVEATDVSGPQVALTQGGPTPVTFTFSPALVLDPTKQHLIGVRHSNGLGVGKVYLAATSDYAAGDAASGDAITYASAGADLGFSAVFAPVPTPVPTLSEWAMIALGLGLAGGAAMIVQRRRTTA